MLSWSDVPYRIAPNLATAEKLMIAERDENECRKDFTRGEAASMGVALEDYYRPDAEERQRATQWKGKDKEGRPIIGSDKLSEPIEPTDTRTTRAKVASAIGMSEGSYARAKAVVKAAEADPETFGTIAEEMDRTGNRQRFRRFGLTDVGCSANMLPSKPNGHV